VKHVGYVAAVLLAAGMICLFCPEVRALINPGFTPIHLVKQSNCVLELRFDPAVKNGRATANVVRLVKGESASKTLTIDLTTTAYQDQAKMLEKMIQGAGEKSALMFIGEFREEGKEGEGGQQGEEEKGKAFLHIGGTWLVLYAGAKNEWQMDEISQHMLGTWAGGTDMLLRAVDYILKDPGADVPVRTSLNWSGAVKFAAIAGSVCSVRPIDLDGDGKLLLFVAAEKGDRLFSCDARTKTLKDVTGEHKLRSTSRAAAWADFNADGKLDLMSWDGSVMSLHVQAADGTFQRNSLEIAGMLKDGCLALSAVDCGVPGRCGVLISTAGSPAFWVEGASGATSLKKLVEGEFPGKRFGTGGKCLVADFDGDRIPDIIQLFAEGGLFYRGEKPGVFAAPQSCPIQLGNGRSDAFVGDWDADGLLDVFVGAEDACRLWHNLGKGKFLETLGLSGEVAYISKPGSIGGMTGDINNDGRQDILVLYSTSPPQLFFNRGFRSFGFCGSLDVARDDLVPEAAKGEQCGCLVDWNGDGAQDLVVVLTSGDGWVFFHEIGGAPSLCARAVLRPGGPYAGPLAVTAWSDDRSLGVWNVVAGTDEAFIGRTEAGPCTLQWQFPGREVQKKEIVLEDKPLRFVLEP